MNLAEEVLKRMDLPDDEARATDIFAAYDQNIDAVRTELNARSPELCMGDLLVAGAIAAIKNRIAMCGPVLHTPEGSVRRYNYDGFGDTEAQLVAEIKAATKEQYQENARRSGHFTDVLDRTVGGVMSLANMYRQYERSYGVRAAAMEWLVSFAKERGLKDDDIIGKAFNAKELEAMYEKAASKRVLSIA